MDHLGWPTNSADDGSGSYQSVRNLVSALEKAARVLTIAAEAHNQLGKVEKHGHLFEVVVFQTMLDQCQPQNKEEWEQCVVQTMSAKNSMLSQGSLTQSTSFRQKPQDA